VEEEVRGQIGAVEPAIERLPIERNRAIDQNSLARKNAGTIASIETRVRAIDDVASASGSARRDRRDLALFPVAPRSVDG
jgi:hypothetical protein